MTLRGEILAVQSNQEPSGLVDLYSRYHVTKAMMLYHSHICVDPQNTVTWDKTDGGTREDYISDLFDAHPVVGDTTYNGKIFIDWEGLFTTVIGQGDDHADHATAMTHGKALIAYIKSIRPNATVGWWGWPSTSQVTASTWYDRQRTNLTIFDDLDFLSPEIYHVRGTPWHPNLIRPIELALAMGTDQVWPDGQAAGRPALGIDRETHIWMAPRWIAKVVGYHPAYLLTETEFKDFAARALHMQYGVEKARVTSIAFWHSEFQDIEWALETDNGGYARTGNYWDNWRIGLQAEGWPDDPTPASVDQHQIDYMPPNPFTWMWELLNSADDSWGFKWILTQGIGFSPGTTKYMPLLGFHPGSTELDRGSGYMAMSYHGLVQPPSGW